MTERKGDEFESEGLLPTVSLDVDLPPQLAVKNKENEFVKFLSVFLIVLAKSSLAIIFCVWVLSASVHLFHGQPNALRPHVPADSVDVCSNVSSISAQEFQSRQLSLAKTLYSLNASAYIAEPGPSSHYYANLSGSAWHLSERPLLLIITPEVMRSGEIQPKITLLTPRFEATRAKLLPIPSLVGNVQYTEWAEEANPYEKAVSSFKPPKSSKVFVDGMVRSFITDGLQNALPESVVSTAPAEVNVLRQRKSVAELELLMCANEATLLSLRSVHKKMYIGMRESHASKLIAQTMTNAGLKDAGCLVLFGENAALPHGAGSDRVLGKKDLALFDCVGTLHGYSSDLTRTVALPDSQIPEEHLHIWRHVHTAQTIALHHARKGAIAKTVDHAAREFLNNLGYGQYFTHRLGHGIGLEVHEGPYLNGGSEDVLDYGHTFSDEPGVYIEGQVGIRLEDCFYIDNTGEAVFLTARMGGQALTPWLP